MNTIKRLTILFHKNNLMFKILLSYIIIGAILLVVLSYILFNEFSKNGIEEIDNISKKMLYQSQKMTDTIWVSTFNHLYQIYNSYDTPFLNALYSSSFEPVELKGIYDRISQELTSNPLIYSMYIFNTKAGKVISNLTPMQKIEDFYDQDIIRRLMKNDITQDQIFIPRKISYKIYNKTTDMDVISVVFKSQSKGNSPDAALIFNLDQRVLQEMVTPEKNDDTNMIFIMDKEGTIISHPQISMVLRNISSESYIERILNAKETEDSFTTNVNGSKALVTYLKSDRLGWVFISIGDYEKLISKITSFRRNVFVLTGIFIILSILIAGIFIRNIYTPLYSLIRKMRTGKRGEEGLQVKSEYDYLTNIYDKLINDMDKLENSIRESLPAKRKGMLRQLVQGELIWIEKTRNEMNEYGITSNSEYYLSCVLRMNSYRALCEKYTLKDIALFRFAIGNIASELFGIYFMSEVVDIETDHICIIVNLPDSSIDSLNKVEDTLKEIQKNVQKYLELSIFASIGNVVNNIMYIHDSYQNALQISDNRIIYGKDAFIKYDEAIANDRELYEYPAELESKLLDYLRLHDEESMGRILDDFLGKVSNYSYNEILLSLTQLTLSTTRVFKGIIGTNIEKYNLSYRSINKKLGDFDELIEIREWLISVYGDMIDAIKGKRQNKNAEIVGCILKYINEKYADSNISVESIADLVDLSPNYARKIFKDSTGKSISNYINEIKFNKVQDLLQNTEYSISKIVGIVGLQNSPYFYASFKKVTGKTPDEYRKEFKMKQISK